MWATSFDGRTYKLTLSAAVRQVGPLPSAAALHAVAVDAQLGQAWAAGTIYEVDALRPALYNAPGIGQGGVRVTTGFARATVTWLGPVDGSGTTDVYGLFSVGALPSGSYQIIGSGGQGCTPGVATAQVKAGRVTAVSALIEC